LAGHHAGILEMQGYGVAVTTNVQIDNTIPLTKHAITTRNKSQEDIKKYSAQVEQFCE